MPATPRYFVSLDAQGRPLFQRSTLRDRPYLSASSNGDSFSSKPPSGAYTLKVVQVEKPIEWVARATLADGTTVTDRSKSCPPGRNFIRYSFLSNGYATPDRKDPAARTTREVFTNRTADHWVNQGSRELEYQIHATAEATIEIRNWPVAGDSVVLPDVVRS